MSAIQAVLDQYVERSPAEPEVGAVRRAMFTSEIRAANEAKREITFVASTESIDRYGDSLKTSGWKLENFRRNPVILWSHRNADPPIGRCTEIHVEASPAPALVASIEFAAKEVYSLAETVYQMYRAKFLRAVSVGFLPLAPPSLIRDEEGTPTGGYEFTSQDLLEISCVNVPANADCIARASRIQDHHAERRPGAVPPQEPRRPGCQDRRARRADVQNREALRRARRATAPDHDAQATRRGVRAEAARLERMRVLISDVVVLAAGACLADSRRRRARALLRRRHAGEAALPVVLGDGPPKSR